MNGQQNTQGKSSGFFEKIKDKVGEARNKIKNALSPNPKIKLDNSENGGGNES